MRILFVLIVVAFALLAGCATSAPVTTPESIPPSVEGPQRGGVLSLSLGDDFVTLHPYFDVSGNNIKPVFYEAPLRIADNGSFEPWLAERWEVSDDQLTVTLHLRQGVKFHNGRELKATDVVWAVEYARDEELGHHLSDRFQTATGATAVDDYTVDIHYSEVNQSYLDGIARLYIFPQEAAETIDTIPVGTGPFRLVEWVPGESLTADRFEEYWQEGQPSLDRLVFKPLPDPQSRLLNLRTGSIDLLVGVPLADKQLLAQESGIVVGEVPPGFNFYAFLMNVNAPPFDNKLVRQALNYAIDRETIVQTAFHGAANATALPYAPSSWAYAEDLAHFYEYNPEKAKELLAEAGYPDGFETTILIRGADGPYVDMAQVFQQGLAAVGIKAKLLPTELPQYWPQLFDSQFDIVSHGTGDATVDPSGVFEAAACCRPFRNFFGITEDTEWFPEYEQVILAARASSDQVERKALYHRALEILVDQGWTIPVAWAQDIYAYRADVKNVRVDQDGLLWLGKAWLDR